jgi:hypothetical protein
MESTSSKIKASHPNKIGKVGRKAIADEDKIFLIRIWQKKSDIDKLGGPEAVTELLNDEFNFKLEQL